MRVPTCSSELVFRHASSVFRHASELPGVCVCGSVFVQACVCVSCEGDVAGRSPLSDPMSRPML